MDISISKISFQEQEKRVFVTVSFNEKQASGTTHSANASVFLDWVDSYAELKRQAIDKAKGFLSRCALAESD